MIGRLRLDELGVGSTAEAAAGLEAARLVEAAIDPAPPVAGDGLGDRVMAAIAAEPAPTTGGFLIPMRRRGVVAGFAESVRHALATLASARPLYARSFALAYVLVIALAGTALAGVATVGAANVLQLLRPAETEVQQPVAPNVVLPPDDSAPVLGESQVPRGDQDEDEGPDATNVDDVDDGPDEVDEGEGPGGQAGPGGDDGARDADDGGGSGPGGGDSSGPGGGGGDDAPSPSSDDHGGEDSGSGSGSGGSGSSDD